jgi:TonB family protein
VPAHDVCSAITFVILSQVDEGRSFCGNQRWRGFIADWGFLIKTVRFYAQRAGSAFKVLCCVALLCLTIVNVCVPLQLHAQKSEQDGEKGARKIIRKVEPDYPWDLKRAHIGGIVRLELAVSQRGTVDNVSVLGGNPILAQSAVNAVKKWKYVPSDSETNIRVIVEFDPSR